MKKPKTMRDRARALAQECVLFGKLNGSQWDGLTELFVVFAENEVQLLGVEERADDDACIHGNKLGACSWCDLRDDGGLPEAQQMTNESESSCP